MAKEKAGSSPLPAADTHAPTKGGVRRGTADPSSPSPAGSDLAAAASEGTFPSPAFSPTRPVVTVPTPMYATDGSGTPIIPKPIGGGGLSSCAPSVAASVSGSSIHHLHHHPHSGGVGFGASASSIGQWGGASASALAATAAGPSPQSARSVTGGRHGHLFSVSQTDGASLASASRYGSAGTRTAAAATVAADAGANGAGGGGAFTTARQALAAGQASPQQSNTNGAHQQRGPDACSSSIDSGLSSSTAAAAQSSAAMGDGDSFGGGGLMSPPHRDAHSPLLTSHHGRRLSPAARGAFSSSTGAEDTCRAGGGHGTAEEVLPVQQVHLSAAGALAQRPVKRQIERSTLTVMAREAIATALLQPRQRRRPEVLLRPKAAVWPPMRCWRAAAYSKRCVRGGSRCKQKRRVCGRMSCERWRPKVAAPAHQLAQQRATSSRPQ